jgi:ribonucleoside-triphosphate reductase
MYFKVSWDEDFDTLMMHLWAKYGREVFTENGIGDQLDLNKFSRDFFNNNTTTADISIDANANVSGKTVIDYNAEFPKPLQKYNSHYLFWKQLKNSYGLLEANAIIEKQINGEIYINDFASGYLAYCFNYSTYDVALNGLTMAANINIAPPKTLHSFIRQMEQFIVYAANSTAGATGLADLLIVASYYIDKIVETGYDGHIKVDEPGYDISDNVRTYVSEMLRSFIYTVNWKFRGAQCVTEDTDVLTPNGWKTLDTLSTGDDIYTWKDGKLNTNKVDSVNIYPYKGEMHRYSGRDVMQEVTPEHRVVYKTGNNSWKIDQSKNLIDYNSPIDFPVSAINCDTDYNISNDLLQFMVFILTDGNIDKQDNKATRIKWYKSKNRWGIDEFEALCKKLNFNYSTRTKTSEFGKVEEYIFSNTDVREVLALMENTKTKLPEFFTKLSQTQSEMVIDLWSKLDGVCGRNRLQCDTKEIADVIQHIAFRAGYGSRQHSRLIKGNKVPTLYVTYYKRKVKTALNKERFYYDGRVWCPTTEDGIVIFRKDGKVFVSGNSPFTNLSVYDDYFLDNLVPDYIFADGKCASISTIKKSQELFISAMNDELRRSDLAFPVTTACFCVKEGEIKDKEFLDYIAEQNLEHGFINIFGGDSSTLSSCCRLRSSTDNEYFNSFGAGSTKIGSLGVVTVNLPRLAYISKNKEDFVEKVRKSVTTAAKINNAKRSIIKKRISLNSMPLYSLGYMDLSKQYSTYGVTGLNEALTTLGYDILSEEGEQFVIDLLDVINEENDKMAKRFKSPHNCEQVPAESSAVKLAQRDRMLKYQDEYALYSNQFIPLTTSADMLDRLRLQGKFDNKFSGGAICHVNVGERIKDKQTLIDLMEYAAKCGVVYWAVNYVLKRCKNSHVFVDEDICPFCGEEVDHATTRTVGFFTNVDHWNKVRREYEFPKRQFYKDVK